MKGTYPQCGYCKSSSMTLWRVTKISREIFIVVVTVWLDLAKNIFAVHGVGTNGTSVDNASNWQ